MNPRPAVARSLRAVGGAVGVRLGGAVGGRTMKTNVKRNPQNFWGLYNIYYKIKSSASSRMS